MKSLVGLTNSSYIWMDEYELYNVYITGIVVVLTCLHDIVIHMFISYLESVIWCIDSNYSNN